jgi:hypothetical protein
MLDIKTTRGSRNKNLASLSKRRFDPWSHPAMIDDAINAAKNIVKRK